MWLKTFWNSLGNGFGNGYGFRNNPIEPNRLHEKKIKRNYFFIVFFGWNDIISSQRSTIEFWLFACYLPKQKLHDWIESSESIKFRFRNPATRGRSGFAHAEYIFLLWISMFNLDLLIGNECKISSKPITQLLTRIKCNKIFYVSAACVSSVRQILSVLFSFLGFLSFLGND